MKTIVDVSFFSPRWGHDDTYSFTFSENSIHINNGAKNAECFKNDNGGCEWTGYNQDLGNPLVKILTNDHIYPPDYFIDDLIEKWESWKDGNLTDNELKHGITEIAEEINYWSRNK